MTTFIATIRNNDKNTICEYMYNANSIEGMFAQYEEDKTDGMYGARPDVLKIVAKDVA